MPTRRRRGRRSGGPGGAAAVAARRAAAARRARRVHGGLARGRRRRKVDGGRGRRGGRGEPRGGGRRGQAAAKVDGGPRAIGGQRRDHVREPGHPRLSPRPVDRARRRRLLPGDQLVRIFPRRADLPQPRPHALAPDRTRADARQPGAAGDGEELGRHLRADAAPPERHLLHDRQQRRRAAATSSSPRPIPRASGRSRRGSPATARAASTRRCSSTTTARSTSRARAAASAAASTRQRSTSPPGAAPPSPRRSGRARAASGPRGRTSTRSASAYYLMISEGGTSYGHKVTIARASAPSGPFEAFAGNPILTHTNLIGEPDPGDRPRGPGAAARRHVVDGVPGHPAVGQHAPPHRPRDVPGAGHAGTRRAGRWSTTSSRSRCR